MASLQTPIYERPYPAESDVPDVATDLAALAGSLETVANVYQGALSAIAAVTPKVSDRYVVVGDSTAINNGLEFYWTGAAWIILNHPSWTSLSLASGLGAFDSAYTSAVRVIGDKVELRGAFANTTGSTKASPLTICTFTTAYRPAHTVYMSSLTVTNGTPISLTVTSAGVMQATIPGGLVSADAVPLDGRNYSLVV